MNSLQYLDLIPSKGVRSASLIGPKRDAIYSDIYATLKHEGFICKTYCLAELSRADYGVIKALVNSPEKVAFFFTDAESFNKRNFSHEFYKPAMRSLYCFLIRAAGHNGNRPINVNDELISKGDHNGRVAFFLMAEKERHLEDGINARLVRVDAI